MCYNLYGGNMYLLYGIEKYLIDEKIKDIIKENNLDNLDINRYNLENTLLQDIIDDASTISLFQNKKMIIVDNAYIFATVNKKTLEQNTDLLIKYIENSNPNTILIFTLLKDKIDTRKKIATLIKKYGKIEEFNTINNISKIVIDLFNPYKIDNKCINLLINRVGNNLSLISSEINKIKIYKDNDYNINEEDIINLTHKNIDMDIFKLIDNILYSKKKEALECLEEMIKYGEEPITITIMLANQIRIMYQSKNLIKKGYSEHEISNILEIHEYRVKKALEKSRNFTDKKILSKLEELADLDYNIKSGNTDKNIGLELFILNM